MYFSRDLFNEGVLGQWYLTNFDASKWSARNTYLMWGRHDSPESPAGHDYDGAAVAAGVGSQVQGTERKYRWRTVTFRHDSFFST